MDLGNFELPAEKLANGCYSGMFNNIPALQYPPILPATTLADYCYEWMFGGTKMTYPPELPATTLADYCYFGMFSGTYDINFDGFVLPATTLANGCYSNMFEGNNIYINALELPATTLANNCYYSMFRGCTSLTYIKVGFTSWNSDYTSNWVDGIASTGTFVKPESLPEQYGVDYIPEGWTVEIQ